jgi:CPA2 family monovalent cation:H+ antiporter-2
LLEEDAKMSTKPLRVVIGTTLGEAEDELVVTGGRVARALGATIHLVHAFELPLPLAGAPFMPMAFEAPLELDEISGSLGDRMEQQIARLRLADGGQIVRHVTPGPAHLAICEVAAREDAGLIVVGATDTLAAHAFGSTASRVLRKSTCPVLVLRGALALPPRRVLLPVDLSPISGEVVTRGLELLDRLGCKPDRAHGHDGSTVEALFVIVPGYASFEPNFELPVAEAGVAKLEAFLAGTAGDRWGIASHCSVGNAREEVLNRIAAARPELVVMGTHGRGGFERLLLGSVAEGVARGCRTSVLVIPPLAARAAAAAPAVAEKAARSAA